MESKRNKKTNPKQEAVGQLLVALEALSENKKVDVNSDLKVDVIPADTKVDVISGKIEASPFPTPKT
jgi:hypothetical protein